MYFTCRLKYKEKYQKKNLAILLKVVYILVICWVGSNYCILRILHFVILSNNQKINKIWSSLMLPKLWDTILMKYYTYGLSKKLKKKERKKSV